MDYLSTCNGICLLFSLLYLPDVGCFLFRFYNSSAAFLPCTFLICYCFLLGYLVLSLLIAFATPGPFRQPYAFLLVLLD